MRFLLVPVLLLVASLSAAADELIVNDQDQANILVLCDTAAQSATVSRQTRALIAQFCVDWEKRMQEAKKPKTMEPPK